MVCIKVSAITFGLNSLWLTGFTKGKESTIKYLETIDPDDEYLRKKQ
ncbi:hypothetical protein [Butyrivibrio sp. AC2005]|nr:hypothetical protein [Butyrivibrio sp. AC2005]